MTINLSKWQTEVWDDDSRYKVINIGRRGGKTTLGAVKLLETALTRPGTISWYVAPTYKQAEQILWQMLKDLVPQASIVKKNEQKLHIILTNKSQIFLKGADNPDSLRGVRIDFCIFDEVAFFDKWEESWKVIRPTLADSKAHVWFISTPNGFNHFKELAEMTDPDWSYHHYTTYDNPHIPTEEIDAMKKEMDEDSFQQEIMGEFRKMSGLIYKHFRRDLHLVDIPDITGWTIYRSLDFGFAHKTALGYFAVNTTGTEIYLYDGFYQIGMTPPEIADAVKIKDSGKFIQSAVADSAQPMQIEELKRLGVVFNPIDKGPDSVRAGITKVAELLKVRADTGKPTLMINRHLTWVADEFEKYRWMEQKSGLASGIKEVPLKRDDDAMDMIRYFAMNWKSSNKDALRATVYRNKKASSKWSLR